MAKIAVPAVYGLRAEGMVNLVQQERDLVVYIEADDTVDFTVPEVVAAAKALAGTSQVETVRRVFEFVRDEIAHSFDIDATAIPCTASEVLRAGHGICFAKANLLAALLRELGCPAGFCYQRLAYGDGFTLHGFNACYIAALSRWIRLDARGNCPGVASRFSTGAEFLAYVPDPEKGERDYPVIYPRPLPQVTALLHAAAGIEDLKARLAGLAIV